jgi:hypothetical protein
VITSREWAGAAAVVVVDGVVLLLLLVVVVLLVLPHYLTSLVCTVHMNVQEV